MKRDPCELLGIAEDDLGLLSGFTSRAFPALAHLREAWCVADASNRVAIEGALRALMLGHSFYEHTPWVKQVLTFGLSGELCREILDVVGIQP